MKKIYFLFLSALFVASMLLSCDRSETYEYNTDIKLDKPNGRLSQMVDCEIMDIGKLLDRSDAVIIGEVMNNGEKYSEPFTEGEADEVALTKTKVRVDEIVYGSVSQDEIYYVQVGNPGDDTMTIKLKSGEKAVLFLVYDEKHDYYCGISFEQSIFYIREDGLYTYANVAELGKYDGTPTELLLGDIKELLKQK